MRGTTPVLVEDPWMRVVDIHWKKKKDDEPPPGDTDDRWCAVPYGWGAAYVDTIDHVNQWEPIGPFQLPPFVGTFTLGMSGIYPPVGDSVNFGGLDTFPPGTSPSDTHTAGPLIDFAEFMIIDWAGIKFQTNWTQSFVPNGFWNLPMAGGNFRPASPSWTVLSLEFDFEWVGAGPPGYMIGIGLSHPRDDGQPMTAPTTPAVVLGPEAGGRAHWSYRPKFYYYTFRNLPGGTPIDGSNEHDPNIGGPALLWYMSTGSTSSGWVSSPTFMDVAITTGGYILWSVYPICGNTEIPPWTPWLGP